MEESDYKELVIRPCDATELTKVLKLEADVIAGLERPDQLRRNTRAMWQACLQPPHRCLGAWSGEKLVAMAVLFVPQPGDGEALAPLLTSVSVEGHRAANYKICLVHPDWRGHHLQVMLGRQLHEEARQRGFDLLCATASPQNVASTKNLLRLGYRSDQRIEKYGFERILFFCFI